MAATATFTTENRSSIKFLAVGDWGGVPYPPYITPVEKATAQEMGRIADKMGADFVLALGDNFYYTGVDSVDSPRFKVNQCILLYLFLLLLDAVVMTTCHPVFSLGHL